MSAAAAGVSALLVIIVAIGALAAVYGVHAFIVKLNDAARERERRRAVADRSITELAAKITEFDRLRTWVDYRSEAYRIVAPEGDPNLEQFINRLALSHVQTLRREIYGSRPAMLPPDDRPPE